MALLGSLPRLQPPQGSVGRLCFPAGSRGGWWDSGPHEGSAGSLSHVLATQASPRESSSHGSWLHQTEPERGHTRPKSQSL